MKQWICTVVISSRQNKSQSRLFVKPEYTHTHFLVCIALSVVLMFADYHYQYFHRVRQGFHLLVFPLQYLVDYPVRVVGVLQSLVSSRTSLVNTNMKLRYQQTILESELQKLITLKEENSQLKGLLLTASRATMKAMAAQILAVDTSDARQLVVLNKGSRDGVYIGQPVLDAKGVMGQILDIGLMTSSVLLISDSKSAIPIRNTRTDERALLTGNNSLQRLSLINLPSTSSIEPQDLLVTSGLGGVYPEGYPVGLVEKVTAIPGDGFVKVDVSAIALLNRSRLVLLVWPDKEQAALSAEIQERLQATETQHG